MESYHSSMIKHWLKGGSVFKYNWLEFWNEFSATNDEDGFAGSQFREELVHKILPKIHTFSLDQSQKKYLMLLHHDIFLTESEEGFNLMVPESDTEKIKLILNRLTSKKTVQYFNNTDLEGFMKRPDLMLWFTLMLKRDELVSGKISDENDLIEALNKRAAQKSEITNEEIVEILDDIECAQEFFKDFLEFLEQEGSK